MEFQEALSIIGKKMKTENRSLSSLSFLLVFITLNSNKLVAFCNNSNNKENKENLWREAGKLAGLLINNCAQKSALEEKHFLKLFVWCLKHKSLMALDKSLNFDVLDLGNGMELVKGNSTRFSARAFQDITTFNSNTTDWRYKVLEKIGNVLNTHVLKIKNAGQSEATFEGRRRRRQQMLMPLMMFGVVAIGMIMIPMGFQFLAVLGGKALLLAKMALILTSIQGLKKIATSNFNYGLYATPPEHPSPWNYDRQWPYDFSIASSSQYDTDYQPDSVFPYHPRITI